MESEVKHVDISSYLNVTFISLHVLILAIVQSSNGYNSSTKVPKSLNLVPANNSNSKVSKRRNVLNVTDR